MARGKSTGGGKGRGPRRDRGGQRGRGHAPRITAVEVFVYRESEVGIEYLLLKRESGLWQPACGKIDDKEVPIEAAEREVREETGLETRGLRPAHWADAFVDPEQGRLYLLPVFVAEVAPDAKAVTGPEHTEHAWLSFEDALERLPYHGYREALRASDAARRMPIMRHPPTPPGPERASGGRERAPPRSRAPAEDASPEEGGVPPGAQAGSRRRRRRGRRGRGGGGGNRGTGGEGGAAGEG